jgi:hypothetical protein
MPETQLSIETHIREYGECYPVKIAEFEDGRLVIEAINQEGYDSTSVDLLDVIAWVRENRPDLLGS